jgi:hypothetical protein
MAYSIVTENVTQQVGPTPSTIQGTGALLSQGATNTAQGTLSLLTQLSDLTPLLTGGKAVTSATQSAGTATITTTVAHGFTVSDTIVLTMAGFTPAAYNGTFTCTITGASTFTYAVSGSPASASVQGTYTPEDVGELVAMATTWFAQGSITSVYVLELGAGNATDGATYLGTWITANPGIVYTYLVPRLWDGNSTFLALIATKEGTTAQTYFWVTTSQATYGFYTVLMKCVNALIECPTFGTWSANAMTAATFSAPNITFTTTTAHGVAVGQTFVVTGMTPSGYNGTFVAQPGTQASTLIGATSAATLGAESVLGTLNAAAASGLPSTEFSQAASMWQWISNNPSSANKVAPMANRFVYGVTPFPVRGNAALIVTLNTANISLIGTGYQGGISNTILQFGKMLDGNSANYWYSADYAQINIALSVTNFVINGANLPGNPVYLNQAGITAGQGVAAGVLQNMITFGLALGSVVQTGLPGAAYATALGNGTFAGQCAINAIPFPTYYIANPGQYKTGTYNGYSVIFTPLQGFNSIQFNITISSFAI